MVVALSMYAAFVLLAFALRDIVLGWSAPTLVAIVRGAGAALFTVLWWLAPPGLLRLTLTLLSSAALVLTAVGAVAAARVAVAGARGPRR